MTEVDQWFPASLITRNNNYGLVMAIERNTWVASGESAVKLASLLLSDIHLAKKTSRKTISFSLSQPSPLCFKISVCKRYSI